jgi:uncharacterized iron-regulated protein
MRFPIKIFLAIFALSACADSAGPPWSAPLAQNHPLVGRIWLPPTSRFAEEGELVERLVQSDFILLGERHDNPDHHRLQARLLAKVIATGRRPAIAFEMIAPEQTAALERHRQTHPEDVEGLAEALDWPHSNWPDWTYYQPLFGEAIRAGLPIRAANLTQETTRAIARGQPIGGEDRRFYGLDKPAPPPLFAAMAEEIRQSHCGQLPERAIAPMVDVQRARDAAMAHALSDEAPNGALLIAGSGHTRSDRGVPMHLAALAPGRAIFSLAFIEVDDEKTDPLDYGEGYGTQTPPFDAIWFTPRANDDDPCAELINMMKRKKEKAAAN